MNKMFQTDKMHSPFNGAAENMETETMQKNGARPAKPQEQEVNQ
jgi:hypothetical protein